MRTWSLLFKYVHKYAFKINLIVSIVKNNHEDTKN